MKQIQDTIMGLASIGVIEAVPAIIQPVGLDYPNVIQTIIQILVGVATLMGLFKRKNRVIN